MAWEGSLLLALHRHMGPHSICSSCGWFRYGASGSVWCVVCCSVWGFSKGGSNISLSRCGVFLQTDGCSMSLVGSSYILTRERTWSMFSFQNTKYP